MVVNRYLLNILIHIIIIYIYINDRVGKCNRIDKCGYHYTPKQYFEDNPWLKEDKFSSFLFHRENEKKKMKTPPPPRGYIPEWVFEQSRQEQRVG